MSADLLLWLILAATTVQNAAWLAASSTNRAAIALLRKHKVELKPSTGLRAFSGALGFLCAAFWTVYTLQIGDWRFAAIAWLPLVFAAIGRVASSGKSVQP